MGQEAGRRQCSAEWTPSSISSSTAAFGDACRRDPRNAWLGVVKMNIDTDTQYASRVRRRPHVQERQRRA